MTSNWQDHRVLVHHGQRDTRKNKAIPYDTITLGEIFDMRPGAAPKDRALAMVPSSYAEIDGRSHQSQRDKGLFVCVCLDIDKGNKPCDVIADMVDAFTGDEVAWLIYSTSSSTKDERRWRVIVPLETPLRFAYWHELAESLFAFAGTQGIEVDRSLSRAGQSVFLPNVPPDRRGQDNKPLFFETLSTEGGRGLRTSDPGPTEWRAKRQSTANEPPTSNAAVLARALRRSTKAPLNGAIHRFNAANRIEDLLVKYQYIPALSGPHWRSPRQTSDSFATVVKTGEHGEQYWVSLSDSDASAGLGHSTASGARTGDAFDLYTHYEHQGDHDAALLAVKAAESATLPGEIEKIVTAAEVGDAGAPFEPQAIQALKALRDIDQAAWVRVRKRLTIAKVGIGELDRVIKQAYDDPSDDERSVADRLINLARQRCRFVRDAQGHPFAVFDVGSARQVHSVDSSSFSEFLSHAYYTEYDRAPNEQALKVALSTLRGQAKFEGETVEVFTRVAKTDAGYWLDLCDEGWRCVQITVTGWNVVAGGVAPLFVRSSSMRPLPLPERGGSLDDLWPLVNVPERDRLLVVTWLLECLRPDTPYVVLELVGEQGSAKSSTQRLLRRLIDPNQADLRAAPRTVEDVWIAAQNSHIVSLENLSHLPPQYQDALCVLATGGGFSARTLYTNAEETILELRKPIVLNGISVVVTAQDLLDRCLHIDLPNIDDRKLSGEMAARFEAAHAKLVGSLLDGFVRVLASLPSVSIEPEHLPRMADFAQLGEAVFRSSGEPTGAFLARYGDTRKEGVLRTIDSSPVGSALLTLLTIKRDGYTGTLSDLLQELQCYKPQGEAWPRSAKGLGDALRRLAPGLRMIGIQCGPKPKTGGVIVWHISRTLGAEKLCPASPECPGGEMLGASGSLIEVSSAGHAGHAGHGFDGRRSANAYASSTRNIG